ncbi:MAG: hypothetical protein AAFR59_13745, partial [Bacteroidota bacterium]
MDNWDQDIRKKAMQARPYKPQSDWARMEHMLDIDTPPAGTKRWIWVFLLIGFFFVSGAGYWLWNDVAETSQPQAGSAYQSIDIVSTDELIPPQIAPNAPTAGQMIQQE